MPVNQDRRSHPPALTGGLPARRAILSALGHFPPSPGRQGHAFLRTQESRSARGRHWGFPWAPPSVIPANAGIQECQRQALAF